MSKIVNSWKKFMNEIITEIKFFDYLKDYHKKVILLQKILEKQQTTI